MLSEKDRPCTVFLLLESFEKEPEWYRRNQHVPLFTKVWVDKKVNNRRQTWIQEMGGVEIKISGQILQQMTGEEYFGLNKPKKCV